MSCERPPLQLRFRYSTAVKCCKGLFILKCLIHHAGVHSGGGRPLPLRCSAVGQLPAVRCSRHMRPDTQPTSHRPHLRTRIRARYRPVCWQPRRPVRLHCVHCRAQLCGLRCPGDVRRMLRGLHAQRRHLQCVLACHLAA